MSTLVIESAPVDKKIQAIKELRAITGLGLKESKAVIDYACAGTRQEIESVRISEEDLRRLLDAGVSARLRGSQVRIADVINVITRFPPSMTVSQLEGALEAMRRSVLTGDLDPGQAA